MKSFTTLITGVFLATLALTPAAHAGSLRQGSAGSSGSAVTGSLPGEVLWTYYQTRTENAPPVELCPPGTGPGNVCNTASEGDNIIRLINPNGAANGNLAGAKTQTVCTMIYVFDDDEEMGECCDCPLSSAQLATFSVEKNLTSNWGLQGGSEGGINGFGGQNAFGSIAITAAAKNAPTSSVPGLSNGKGCAITQSGACNKGCDPTNVTGYSVTTASNLLGSVTHNQGVVTRVLSATSADALFGITEVALSDDASGDPTNLTYLQTQCGALVGNGTGGGICNCPTE